MIIRRRADGSLLSATAPAVLEPMFKENGKALLADDVVEIDLVLDSKRRVLERELPDA